MSPCPWYRMSMKALRSRLNAIARRKSRLSKGGLSRLTSRCPLVPPFDVIAQIARGSWLCTSFNNGAVRLPGQIMSNWLETNAITAVDMFLMIGNSMPSR